MNPVLADHEIQVFKVNHRRMMSELAKRQHDDTDAILGDSVAETRKASNANGSSFPQQFFSFIGRAPRTLQNAGH